MATVNGKNVILYIYDNGGWRMYACARSCSLQVTASTVEISTTGSGNWASFEPQKLSFSGSCDGVVNLQQAGLLTLADLRAKQIAFTKLLINFERTDEDGNVYTDQGTVIITGSSDTGSINDVATFNIDFIGTGALTQIFTPTPLELSAVTRYQATSAGGETTINIPSLANKDILSVVKDGIGNCLIITSGVPVSKQVLYDVATGDFTWMVPFEAGETYYILYQSL
jgi:predicted secreted protein